MTGVVGSGSSVNIFNTSCNTTLNTFTTEQDLSGAFVNVVVPGSNATVIAFATFTFSVTTSGVSMLGYFNWNNTDQTQTAMLTSNGSTDLVGVSQSWVITAVSAGTYTAKMRAACSSSSATNQVLAGAGLTFLNIMVLGNSLCQICVVQLS